MDKNQKANEQQNMNQTISLTEGKKLLKTWKNFKKMKKS
jgi:hypothetical protein